MIVCSVKQAHETKGIVSPMQALGVDIQTIQSIVGHADTEMTAHDLHVQESIRQSAIRFFDEAFSA